MSEAFTDAADQNADPIGEDAFEAARLAEEADAPEVEESGEEEGEPEAKAAVDWEKKAHDKEGLAAKERARRRAAESRARDLEERLTRLETTAKPKPSADEDLLSVIDQLRDDDDDPITDLASVKRALKLFKAQTAQEAEAEARANAQQANVSRLLSAMNESEAEFAEDHPDYQDAVKHFKAARQSEFEDMGYSGAELQRAMAEDLLGLATRAIQGGRDPAEVVYNLAKKRGFKAGDAQAQEKLKQIAKAAEAGGSPKGGMRGETRLTYGTVASLKGAAFDAAFEKLRQQERRAG